MGNDPNESRDKEFRAWQDKLTRMIMRLNEMFTSGELQGAKLRELRARAPQSQGGDVLLIVKVESEGTRFVAFISGEDMETALLSLVNKAHNKSLKFKDDAWPGGG